MAPLPVFHRPLSMDSRDTSLTNSSSNSRPKGDTSAESGSGGCVGGGSTVSTIAASAASGAAAMNTSASIPNVSVGADTQSTTTNPELASSNDYLVPSTKASTPPRRYVHTLEGSYGVETHRRLLYLATCCQWQLSSGNNEPLFGRSKPQFGRNSGSAECETSFTTKSGVGGRRGYSGLLQGDPLNTNSGGGSRKTSQQHRMAGSPDRRRGRGGGTMQGSTSSQPLLSSDRSLDDDDDGCGGGDLGAAPPPPLPLSSSSAGSKAAAPLPTSAVTSPSGGSGCPTRPLPPTPCSSAVPSPMTPLDAGSLVMTPGIPQASQR